MMVAAYLAVIKAGAIVVATMPLLRAKEIAYPIGKAKIHLALCDHRLADEMEKARALTPDLERVIYWGSGGADALETLMATAGYESFAPCDTASDDVCLIAFTSGTTGEPKGTMHFHRDILATCDSYGRHVLRAEATDHFIGSPPLAFTFGLGGLVLFPLRVGAASILIEKASPDDLLAAIDKFRATIVFTAPTAYRAMLAKLREHDVSSLRKCVSAGEALPKATFEAWLAATGIKILDGIGATEMLHIFIGSPEEEIRPGATGKSVPGYEARVVDADGKEVAPNSIGRLAVRGPTGCRYLADKRQRQYVQNGWNVTGDTYLMDADGYFWYQARSDDMIVSAGYNIAGPEVEAALLEHPAVAECGVVGAPDEERGQIVKAYVVLRGGHSGDAATTKLLQEHVKATIAPYKYPRTIEYVTQLPRTQTGKLQRFELRRMAADTASHKLAS
jgi:2-aminobenzoate-CoA ligase